MLEQRMNQNINFREATPHFSMSDELNDFSYDINA